MSESFKKVLLTHLGKQLKQIRQDKGLALIEVAMQTDLSLVHLVLLEEGKSLSYKKCKQLVNFYEYRKEFA